MSLLGPSHFLVGLRSTQGEDSELPHVVGGVHPEHSLIRTSRDGNGIHTLDKSKLAPLVVSTCLKRLDKRSDLQQVQAVPRSRITTASEEFEEVGKIADACCFDLHKALFDLICMRQ